MLSALVGTVGTLAAPIASRAHSQPLRWKTAVGLNGFASASSKYKASYPIWDVLDFVADQGFDGVELVEGWPSGGYPIPGQDDQIRSLRRMYDQYGLRVFSIQNGAGGAFSPSAEERQHWIATMRQRLAFAAKVGCRCIGMWPGGGLRGQDIGTAVGHLADSFRQVADTAEALGILAAFEIEPPFVFNTESLLREILQRVDHPNLKTIYDPSHFDLMNGSSGAPHEMLSRIGVEHIGYVHLTDTDGTLRDGGTSKHLACGDGHAQIPESLRVLSEGGFKEWIMIDAWEIPDPYDACRKGLRAIHAAGKA